MEREGSRALLCPHRLTVECSGRAWSVTRMISSRLRALITVSRLEYTTLIVGALTCLAAKRAGVDEAVIFAIWLLVALGIRSARNRGALDQLVAKWSHSPPPE